MKSIIYKNPVISAILFNLFTLLLSIYMYKHDFTTFIIMIMILNGILGGKIMKSTTNISNKKKVFIIVSCLVMTGVFMFCIYNMTLNKFINK